MPICVIDRFKVININDQECSLLHILLPNMLFHELTHFRLIVQICQGVPLCLLFQQLLVLFFSCNIKRLPHDLIWLMILIIDRNPYITEPDKYRFITDLSDFIGNMLITAVHGLTEGIKNRPVIRMYKSPFVHLLLIIFDDHIGCAPFPPELSGKHIFLRCNFILPQRTVGIVLCNLPPDTFFCQFFFQFFDSGI